MLDKHEISLGCLMTYFGFIVGLGLLVASEFVGAHDLGRWGIAVLCLACTYSIHRSLEARDERLRRAFNLGPEDEHRQNLTAVR